MLEPKAIAVSGRVSVDAREVRLEAVRLALIADFDPSSLRGTDRAIFANGLERGTGAELGPRIRDNAPRRGRRVGLRRAPARAVAHLPLARPTDADVQQLATPGENLVL